MFCKAMAYEEPGVTPGSLLAAASFGGRHDSPRWTGPVSGAEGILRGGGRALAELVQGAAPAIHRDSSWSVREGT